MCEAWAAGAIKCVRPGLPELELSSVRGPGCQSRGPEFQPRQPILRACREPQLRPHALGSHLEPHCSHVLRGTSIQATGAEAQQPPLTFPHGHGQDGSPGLEAFHRAKSLAERFSLKRSAETLRSPVIGQQAPTWPPLLPHPCPETHARCG